MIQINNSLKSVLFLQILCPFLFSEYEKWYELSASQKKSFTLYCLEKLEVVNIQEQRNAAQSILYLTQGINLLLNFIKQFCTVTFYKTLFYIYIF